LPRSDSTFGDFAESLRCDHRTRVSTEKASELRAKVEELPGWRIFIY